MELKKHKPGPPHPVGRRAGAGAMLSFKLDDQNNFRRRFHIPHPTGSTDSL
jgi:hypothetical protein